MRTLVAVVGWVFIAMAILGVIGAMDDAKHTNAHNVGVGIAIVTILGGAGALIVRHSRRMARPELAGRATIIIRAAQKRSGRITAAEVAADTTLAFEDAKIELERLAKAGACEVVVGDAGILVYRFPEFESAANKQDSV